MKKKIGIAIAFTLIFVIAVAVIVMVCVKVNYKPEIINPTTITVLNSEKKSITLTEDNENLYNQLIDEFEKSFTRTYLSALFAGQTFNNSKVILIDGNKIENFEHYKITFNYSNNPQSLIVDGIEQPQQYSQIVFGVSEFDGYQQINIYFKHSIQTGQVDKYYSLTTYSSQKNFYDFLNSIEDYK